MIGKITLFILALATCSYGTIYHPVNPNSEKQYFFLTFPRSGTNLTSCYIQATTGIPIWFLNQVSSRAISNNRLGIKLDYSKKPLFRTHTTEKLQGLNTNGNKLLFVLRNYRECIHRRVTTYDTNESFKNLFLSNEEVVQQYIENLTAYDAWDPLNRLMIFYEDLISNPVKEVAKILTFLEEPFPDFLDEGFLAAVSKKTLESYHQQHIGTGGSHSKGKDPDYHSKQLPIEYIHEIDAAMEATVPTLWEKYLKRYQFSENLP